jgi:hypothetical protein
MTNSAEPEIDPNKDSSDRDQRPRTVLRRRAVAPAAAGPAGVRLRTTWPPLAVLLSGAGVLTLVLLDGPAALRAVSVLTYIAVVPGLACARLIRLPDPLTQFVVGVALSVALGILVAQAMVYLQRWSPLLGLYALAVIASLAALIELVRDRLAARRRLRQVISG